jgi:cytochrome c oxidase cbb3-type subunit 1
MWVAGIMEGLMWRAYTSLGFLEYSFVEVVEAVHPLYIVRALGGAMFLIGALIMAYNLVMTILSPDAAEVPETRPTAPIPALSPAE